MLYYTGIHLQFSKQKNCMYNPDLKDYTYSFMLLFENEIGNSFLSLVLFI